MLLYAGIILGLLAAVSQSTSYLLAKSFTTHRPGGRRRLLISSHIFIGLISIIAIPFLWPDKVDNYDFIPPAIICTVAYLFAQGMMFMALHSTDASRVSPLLAGKIVVIALIMFFTGQADINTAQWVAIGLAILAAVCINHAGGSIPLPAIAAVILACLGYSISDVHIYNLMQTLKQLSDTRATLLGVAMCYALAGLICLPVGLLKWRETAQDMKHVSGFSAVWTLAMIFLFSCFAFIGPIYGNILQSTRGIISIAMGAIIAKLGHHHLEKKVSPKVFIARIIAALILIAAITMYKMADQKEEKQTAHTDMIIKTQPAPPAAK